MSAAVSGPAPATGNGHLRSGAGGAPVAWALRSDPGAVRPHNEDYAAVWAPPDVDRGPLFVVCDGLGGHRAGEVASRLAVDAAVASWSGHDGAGAPQAMRAAVRAANTAVFDTAAAERIGGMATTMTALTIAGREAVVAHVGDSRAYLVRSGACTQLTADHSRVGEMLRMGMLSPEQAASHPGRSQLTRVIGTEPIVGVDILRSPVRTGDVFVVCSDGVWDVLASAQIADTVTAAAASAAGDGGDAAGILVDEALKAGSTDNVTAVVVTVTGDGPLPGSTARRSLFRRDRR